MCFCLPPRNYELTTHASFNARVQVDWRLQEEQSKQSIRSCLQRIQHDSRCVKAYQQLGAAFVETHRYDKALQFYQRVKATDPQLPEVYCGLGYLLLGTKQYYESLQCFYKSLELNPDSFKTLTGLTKALAQAGQRQQSQKVRAKFVGLIQLVPQDAEDCYLLASLVPEQSEYYARKAIELNPKGSKGYVHLINILYSIQKYTEAVDCLREMIRIDPENDGNYQAVAILLNRHKQSQVFQDAKAVIEETLQKYPDSPAVLVGVGRLFYALQDEEEAVRCMQKAISVNPKFAPAYSWLQTFQRFNYRSYKALQYLKAIIRISPLFQNVQQSFIEIFRKLHFEEEQVVNCCEQMASLHPQSAELHYKLARILCSKGLKQKAEQSCLKALKINPRCTKTYQLLVSNIVVEVKKKISLWNKILEIDPQHSALWSLSQCLIFQDNSLEGGFDLMFRYAGLNPAGSVYLFDAILSMLEDNPKYGDVMVRILEFMKKQMKKYPGNKILQQKFDKLTLELDYYKNR